MWRLTTVVALGAVMGGAATCAEWMHPRWISCPNHNYPVVTESDSFSIVPLAGATTEIPEFHDCQRLLVEQRPGLKPLVYGPLVGIWSAETLDNRLSRLEQANRDSARVIVPREGGIVAQDTVEDSLGIHPVAIGPMALAFAEIFAWDGPYKPLGIHRGWNCLYIYPAPDTVHLGARMLGAASKEECLEIKRMDRLTGPNVTKLYVRRMPVNGLSSADYPPVSRWDYDRKHDEQYIGIKCGGAWCEVTARDSYASSPSYVATGAVSVDQRVIAVKGWYDEQTLGIREPGILNWIFPGLYPIHPAPFTGTIVPDPALDGKPTEWFNEWRLAGYVVLGGDHEKYRERGFGRGSMPSGAEAGTVAKVFMCQGSGCGQIPISCTWGPGIEKNWWARIEYPGSTKYRCINRVNHENLGRKIPGTARWFFEAWDEKGWYGCTPGCCTTQ